MGSATADDAETEDTAEASEAAAAVVAGVRPPRPSNWESMYVQEPEEKLKQQGGRPR